MSDRSEHLARARRKRRSPPHRRREPTARAVRGRVADRWLAGAAAGVAVALLAIARYCIDPVGILAWSWPVLMLCVLVAAAAGRALLGRESTSEEEERAPSTRGKAAIWLVLLGAAIVPNLHGLGVGFLAEDLGLLGAARLADNPLDILRFLPLKIFYRPVPLLVWWAGLRLWNGAPLGYHLVSALVHAANTALLYSLARQYTASVFGGIMAALLFAVHPMHVEATTWLAAQPDVIGAAFGLSSMWLLERYIRTTGARKHLSLVGALAAFLLALWSKETTAALPAIVFVRLAVIRDDQRWARTVGVSAAYALTMGIYLGSRFVLLGKHWLGGYATHLALRDSLLSPMPWLLTGQLLFPVHVTLFRSLLFPYLWLTALTVMAIGLLWMIRSLVVVSWQRLLLYASFLLVPMIPVSTAGLAIGADMANARYGYLPSVGVALLFGEICARRRGGWRGCTPVGLATLSVAAVLSVWYVMPWRGAARLRQNLLAEGARIVASLPDSPPPSTVFFRNIPYSHLGAAAFPKEWYAQDLAPLLNGRVCVADVASNIAAWDAVSESDLAPGEYIVTWDADSESMVIVGSGIPRAAHPALEAPP